MRKYCQRQHMYSFMWMRKSREITDADVEKLNRLPGCEAMREYRIVWGGFAHVQAIVKLMAMALSKEDVSYMHLLAGEDFPLLTPEQLDEKFLTSDQIFMDYLAAGTASGNGNEAISSIITGLQIRM